MYINCKPLDDLIREIQDPDLVPKKSRYWDPIGPSQSNLQKRRKRQGRRASRQLQQLSQQRRRAKSGKRKQLRSKVTNSKQKDKSQKRRRGRNLLSSKEYKRNSRPDCRRPNAENLVRQLYKKCRESGECPNDRKVGEVSKWESIYEVFSRFSYVNTRLREYITTKEFRKNFMFDGEKLTRNIKNNVRNRYILIAPSYGKVGRNLETNWYRDEYPYGLANIDGKFPDPFYRATEKKKCPAEEPTMFNCYGKCRNDNCNENPPAKRGDIKDGDLVPNIISIPLKDFINGDLKDFIDPFEGQLGYDTRGGTVRNADNTYSVYHHNKKLVRSNLTRVSQWTGGDTTHNPSKGKFPLWDGIGLDPYRLMHYYQHDWGMGLKHIFKPTRTDCFHSTKYHISVQFPVLVINSKKRTEYFIQDSLLDLNDGKILTTMQW